MRHELEDTPHDSWRVVLPERPIWALAFAGVWGRRFVWSLRRPGHEVHVLVTHSQCWAILLLGLAWLDDTFLQRLEELGPRRNVHTLINRLRNAVEVRELVQTHMDAYVLWVTAVHVPEEQADTLRRFFPPDLVDRVVELSRRLASARAEC